MTQEHIGVCKILLKMIYDFFFFFLKLICVHIDSYIYCDRSRAAGRSQAA